METGKKENSDKCKKMEIEQKLMDKDISKMKLRTDAASPGISTDMFGQAVDRKSSIQAEHIAGIEINNRKIGTQTYDLQRLHADNTDLTTLQKTENEKNGKLLVIARDKYNIDVDILDQYLPKGKEYGEKLKNLEKHLIKEARKEHKEIKSEMAHFQNQVELDRKARKEKEDKIEVMRLKLKNRAMAAQKVVNRALEVGEGDKVKQLQDINLKVFSLLNLPMSDLRKSIPKLSVPSPQKYKSDTFNLTGVEPDEEIDQPIASTSPYKSLGISASKQQKSISRFETPAQDNKNQNSTSRERSEPKKLAPKISANNKGSKPNFMMSKKIGEMPMRD